MTTSGLLSLSVEPRRHAAHEEDPDADQQRGAFPLSSEGNGCDVPLIPAIRGLIYRGAVV